MTPIPGVAPFLSGGAAGTGKRTLFAQLLAGSPADTTVGRFAATAVVVIDVVRDLPPQFERALAGARRPGIRNVIVAVNKMDIAHYRREAFMAVQERVNHAFADEGVSVQCVPVSASGGDMVTQRGGNLWWYSGPTLLEALAMVALQHAPGRERIAERVR